MDQKQWEAITEKYGQGQPCLPDLEAAVLAACLWDGMPTLRRVRQNVRIGRDDFGDPRHKIIWRAMERLADSGKTVDMLTVESELDLHNKLEAAGGSSYLDGLRQPGASFEAVEDYARQVREYGQRWRLQQAGMAIIDKARSSNLPMGKVYADILDTIDGCKDYDARPFTTARVGWEGAFDRYGQAHKAKAEKRPIRGLLTGMDTFDSWHEYQFDLGTFMLLFGSTGLGKSTLAAKLATGYALHGIPVLYVTLEMSNERVMDRMIAGHTLIPETVARRGDMTDSQWGQLTAAGTEFETMPLTVTDQCNNASEMAQQAMAMTELHDGKRGVLIIDTINSMQDAGKSDNPYQRITNAVIAIDSQIKLKTGWAVIGLAQQRIDLDGKVSTEKLRSLLRPNLGNIQNSRELAQKAEFMGGLYSWEYWQRQVSGFDDPFAHPAGYIRLDMVKSRYSQDGVYCCLRWHQGVPAISDEPVSNVDLDTI